MKKVLTLVVVLAASVALPLSVSAPADAVSCTSGWKRTAPNISNSAQFSATSTCDGAYAGTTGAISDYVRGRFLKDGSWQTSTYGYVWVSSANDGWDKVIGNMVTGRAIRGQSYTYDQGVSYLY